MNSKNGTRPFNAEELTSLRESAGEDMFIVLLLRWTGLRGSDALGLRWENVHFGNERRDRSHDAAASQARHHPALNTTT
jgi:integrase